MSETSSAETPGLTAQIVAAHIGKNQIVTEALPELIQSVYRALTGVTAPAPEPEAPKEPAVPVKKSVFPDYIVCLEDGEKLKMLKRHRKTSYNMSPAEYRTKWRLPSDYPMVAPSYASKRSSLAKSIGLGRKPAEATIKPEITKIPARRARGSKG